MRPSKSAQLERKRPGMLAGALLACLGAGAITIGTTGTAAASDSFTIDLYTVVRDDPGTETSLGSWSVPEDLQGRTCVATSMPENNSSIHPGNDLRVVSDTTITLSDIEGTGNPVTSVDQITLGSAVEVILEMGPDGVFSAGLTVSIDCPAPPTTTTAAPTTTTTTTSTSTTTTVAPTSTTTTTEPELVGNNPPTTSSTTTTEATTTTEGGQGAATTTVASTNPSTTVAAQLPRTGSTNTMLALGALLLLAGGAMVLTTRRDTASA